MTDQEGTPIAQRNALRFVVLLGIVSLFADMTYEGARSINGQFLESLGASGTTVGLVAGAGELLSYSIRLGSGYISDRRQNYWILSFIGYFVNLLAVPLLALAGNWPLATILMISERIGKGIRNPPRDAMLSHAGSVVGTGFTFGLHEAMDQIGAILGPLIVVAIYATSGAYQQGYTILLIPATLALSVLSVAYFQYPNPKDLEKKQLSLQGRTLPREYWRFIAVAGFIAAGFADFPLIGYHLSHGSVVNEIWIPVLYSIAMAIDALTALAVGRWYDRIGLKTLGYAIAVSAFFAPLVFLGNFAGAIMGMILWGVGMGAQESVVGAAIADLVPFDRRGSAYGIFYAIYGVSWFTGSLIMGTLLDVSVIAIVGFSMASELFALLILRIVIGSK